MDSTWGSGRELDIGKNSLVMSETGIPAGFPFPIVFGSGENLPPRQRMGMGMEIFSPNGDGSGELFPTGKFPAAIFREVWTRRRRRSERRRSVFSTASTWRRSEAPASCRRSEASAWRRRRGGAHRGHGGGCAVEGAWWRADAE
jgi:hypothetical protein